MHVENTIRRIAEVLEPLPDIAQEFALRYAEGLRDGHREVKKPVSESDSITERVDNVRKEG